ncbi:MAG TPA: CsgG/HfaB family protein [Flavobacteriales bacterium]|jgi:tetratricopeptide (TPR) repeat protein|nr:CsgG/HfaB family protein [Flavobacteriales bacterium]
MPIFSRIALPLALATMVVSCSGSKSFSKKAAKLDEAGLYAEAAEMYLQSAQRSNKNVDAKIGLKKTGQMLLNDKLSTFFKNMAMGSNKGEAVAAYLEAKRYQDQVGRLGVVLEIPDHYRTDFERVKGEHLVDLYDQGQALLAKQDFRAAELLFSQIAKLEPNYKDASSLQAVAYLEPLYRAGKADLEAGHYRKAYDELGRVVEKDPGYKDSGVLRQEALTKGQYSIAVLPFTTSTKRTDVTSRVQAHAMTSLVETKDPFLKIVDRENIERILEEQRLGLSGVVDEQTAVRVGNLIGAQAVLMGTVMDYREEPGTLRRSTKDAYESYRVQQVNKETGEKYFVTKYKPTRYTEYYQENKVVMSFSYRLVSLETGEVLASKVVEREAGDHMYYATYDGNGEQLLPARNGQVDLADRARRDLRGLLSAPREMKSIATLSSELVRSASSVMAVDIQSDLSSRLP